MIETWQQCSNFKTTNQRLADQVRTIIKKGWFYDVEIIEIHQKINYQSDNTVPDTSNINKQKQPNRNEPPTSENGNSIKLNTAQTNIPEQTLGPKLYLEKLKRIMKS